MGRNSLVTDINPITSRNCFVDTLKNNIINDSVQIEIPKLVMDVLRTCSISNGTTEPYHQSLNLAEWKYRTIKLWTINVMNGPDAPSNYWLLCVFYLCYLLNQFVPNNPKFLTIALLQMLGGIIWTFRRFTTKNKSPQCLFQILM